MKQRIIVVGNGMVGHKFIDGLLNSDNAADYEILTFSEEPRLAYDRVKLSYYFAGSTVQDLMLTSETEYQTRGVLYTLNDKVVHIDTANNSVTTASGRMEHYDKLVLATHNGGKLVEFQDMLQSFGLDIVSGYQCDVVANTPADEIATGETWVGLQAKQRSMIDDIAATYENPDEVVAWYYGNEEQLTSVQSAALEDQAFDLILEQAQVQEETVSYDELIKQETKQRGSKSAI